MQIVDERFEVPGGDAAAIEWFSIDVFDTVTTRAVAAPADVFLVVGERVRDAVATSPAEFARLRREAEAALRRRLPAGGDVSLLAIHEELLTRLPRSAAVLGARGLAELESEAEVELARPWQPGLHLLDAWRGRAKFLGFVSDMYLPSDTVRRILVAAGAWREGDALYVSSEEQATKASGRLFELLARRHGIALERWLHFGDQAEADVAVPRRLGMRSMAVRRPAASRRTREAFGGIGDPGVRSLRLEACLRQAAGAAPAECDMQRREIWRLGAHVLGPTVAWYAHEVLHEAEKAGLQNLWFLARDGEIVSKAAAILNANGRFAGRLHYVLASRRALHLASLAEFDAEAERWILANPTSCTAEGVARRLGIEGPLRDQFIERLRPACQPQEPIAGRQANVWDVVRSPPFGDAVLDIAREQRRACQAYLSSISAPDSLGVVDIGWHANLQCSLQILLEREDITGFYLGLLGRNPRVPQKQVRPLLFRPNVDSDRLLGAGISVLEMLFAGSHPGLVRYGFDDSGRAIGVLADAASWERQLRWGVPELQGGALDAVRRLVEERLVPTRDEVAGLLRGFLTTPSVEEVDTIRNWPTQDLQAADAAAPLVERVAWGALLRACLTGRVPRVGHWDAGARVVNGVIPHFAYRALRRVYRRSDR